MKKMISLISIIMAFIACVKVTENVSLNESINVGQFDLEEISAATMLPGNRLLIASDEGKIFLLEGAAERLKNKDVKPGSFKPIKAQVKIDDIEDIALTTNSEVYFVTSHSRNRRRENADKRYKIAVLQLESDGKPKEPIALDSLKLKDFISSNLKTAIERTPAQSGFNIEGAAWNSEGHLLLGLRSPTLTSAEERANKLNEDAIILRIKDPKALFSSENLQIEETSLNLEGKGIRAMHYDSERKGVWIVTGLSPDPNYDVQNDWNLWFWDEKNSPRKMTELGDAKNLNYPEAICLVKIDNTSYLLIIEDSKTSRYAVIPVPKS